MSAINALLPCISALLAEASDDLATLSESPRLDAELLLAFVLQVPRSYLFAHPEERPGREAFAIYRDLVGRRKSGEPVAYITGHREFWSMDLIVNRHTLIPRPDTETLVLKALELMHNRMDLDVLDLGTGSGAVALALARERADAKVVGTDTSAEAVGVARYNAERLGVGNVEFLHGDWFAPVTGRRFDIIVSNPPYVAESDPHLARAEIRYEPCGALVAGKDGLDSLSHIVESAPAHLRPGGWILVEHGERQRESVRELLATADFGRVETAKDLAGRARVTFGQARGRRA